MLTGGFINVVYQLSVWVMRVVSLNLLWIIFNIPLGILTMNLFIANNESDFLANLIGMFILIPFILFPSTTALFGVARKWVIREDDIFIARTFLKLYKENYKRSILGGFVFAPLWFLITIDYFYFTNLNSPLFYLFLAICMFVLVGTFHFFSNTVHYHLTLVNSLKNSMLLALGKPLQSIGIAVGSIIIIFICVNYLQAFILFIAGVSIAYLSFFLYFKSINNQQ